MTQILKVRENIGHSLHLVILLRAPLLGGPLTILPQISIFGHYLTPKMCGNSPWSISKPKKLTETKKKYLISTNFNDHMSGFQMHVKALSRKLIPVSCWKTIIAMIYLRRTNIAAKLPTKPIVATDGRHTWRRRVC